MKHVELLTPEQEQKYGQDIQAIIEALALLQRHTPDFPEDIRADVSEYLQAILQGREAHASSCTTYLTYAEQRETLSAIRHAGEDARTKLVVLLSNPKRTFPEDVQKATEVLANRSVEKEARDMLVERNMPLACSMARKRAHMGVEMDDLISEATFALMRAALDFNPKIARFTTYAKDHIRSALNHLIANTRSAVRIPYYATYTEGAAVPDAMRKTVQFSQLENEDGRMIEPSKNGEFQSYAEDMEEMATVWGLLPVSDRVLLQEYFGLTTGEGKSLKEIGDAFGVTRERIRQLLEPAKERCAKTIKQRQRIIIDIPPPGAGFGQTFLEESHKNLPQRLKALEGTQRDKRPGHTYDPVFQIQVLDEIASNGHGAMAQVSERERIPKNTLIQWKKDRAEIEWRAAECVTNADILNGTLFAQCSESILLMMQRNTRDILRMVSSAGSACEGARSDNHHLMKIVATTIQSMLDDMDTGSACLVEGCTLPARLGMKSSNGRRLFAFRHADTEHPGQTLIHGCRAGFPPLRFATLQDDPEARQTIGTWRARIVFDYLRSVLKANCNVLNDKVLCVFQMLQQELSDFRMYFQQAFGGIVHRHKGLRFSRPEGAQLVAETMQKTMKQLRLRVQCPREGCNQPASFAYAGDKQLFQIRHRQAAHWSGREFPAMTLAEERPSEDSTSYRTSSGGMP